MASDPDTGEEPQTLYALRPDGVSVAYQVLGTGPVDVVNVPGSCPTWTCSGPIPNGGSGPTR